MRYNTKVILHLGNTHPVPFMFIGIQALHEKKVRFAVISKFKIDITQLQCTGPHFQVFSQLYKLILGFPVVIEASVVDHDLLIDRSF